MNAKFHSKYELQNEENAHSNSKISTHERDVHSDSKAERENMKTRIEPRLSKYVRRHHPAKQIIGDKEAKPMIRNKLRNASCLLSKIEPNIVKDALEDDGW